MTSTDTCHTERDCVWAAHTNGHQSHPETILKISVFNCLIYQTNRENYIGNK